MRCQRPVYEPGGGGINVSKALKIMGAPSQAFFLGGGPTGVLLEHLIQQSGIGYRMIETEDWTRENLLIIDQSTGQEYKFIMPGPRILLKEWKNCMNEILSLQQRPEFVILSGSLPLGVPDNAYIPLVQWANEHKVKIILDTSGPALAETLREGVFLIKPNLSEMAALAGVETITANEEAEIAKGFIADKKCKIVVVSLGARGALMVSEKGTEYVVPPTVPQQSSVGAGDSMVAGMVYALSQNWDYSNVLRYGVAAGTAATMTAGTELCRKEDVDRIFKWLT